MGTGDGPLTVRVLVRTVLGGVPLGDVAVEAVSRDGDPPEVVARATTRADGLAVLEIDPRLWRSGLSVGLTDGSAEPVDVTHEVLDGEEVGIIDVQDADELDRDRLALLADHLVATRRVRAGDLAADVAAPAPDSILHLFSAAERARLLTDLSRRLPDGTPTDAVDRHFLDPEALRGGEVVLVPVRDLDLHVGDRWDDIGIDRDDLTQPGRGWERLPWTKPDDQSYRDYLRGVFVLFAHQQKDGAKAGGTAYPAIVEQQLTRRFFQDFRTVDRVEASLNRLVARIVLEILQAPTGTGFGFGLAAAALPARAGLTDREYLDALLASAPIDDGEFANRYRLPLGEPDGVLSTPVKLNIHTLSRILSDTAQGPVEPPDNGIEPQLPGERNRPILWDEVVGSAPFFLRLDEWLARQQPFFPENLFAVRTQVEGIRRGVPWLTEDVKKFLEYHKSLPLTWELKSYNGLFASMDEVNRSATFLLSYGAADAKLTELVHAIDKSQFAVARRLADEAADLLHVAMPSPSSGEDWRPAVGAGNFSRPMGFAQRRRLRVGDIVQLTGDPSIYPPHGLERYFELDRPIDPWKDVHSFRATRDLATRLREYQLRFVLPVLRALVRTGLGDLPGAVDGLAPVTGLYIGIAKLGTRPGMVEHPGTTPARRVVATSFDQKDPLGDRAYTARLVYDEQRRLAGPFPLTPQYDNGDVIEAAASILHPLEERYARIQQADALLAWAETLYRADDGASLERARELYKAVVFLHGEDPGTSAFAPFAPWTEPWFGLVENPRVRNQLDRARLALRQLEAGLNFYGYSDEAVPTLRYETLASSAQRWATAAKGAQADFLAYLGRVEHLELDMLAAKAQERKARATVAIAAEQVEVAQAGVIVAKKLVADVEKQIVAKQGEINDANSLFSQFKDYFTGMKDSVSSMVDIGRGASEGWTSLSTSGVGDAVGLGQGAGGGAAAAGGETVGLGSAMSGLGVVGGFAAFAVLSTTTLQGMAEAATKRDGELKALRDEALPAALAAVRVQERNVTIARLHGEIATTDLAYARDLITYQNERFLNRDFWDALAGVARRSLHRYLDLAAQQAWLAERSLAYLIGTSVRVIRLTYFDPRMRDVGGVDRLALDLAELEAIRLRAARVTVPLTRTYSLAQDLPLAFGRLKTTGRCTFTLSDADLVAAHPGTYAHRIRAVDVVVDTPGTPVSTRGILTNDGFSLFSREPGGRPMPLVRFADAYPISEFEVRRDLALHGLPGEGLLPFEGSGFTTAWALELPQAANAAGLNRVTDVRLTFDVRAAYAVPVGDAAPAQRPRSRAVFASALAIDAPGYATLRKTGAAGSLAFALDALALPPGAKITNIAVLLPGVVGGSFASTLQLGNDPGTSFTIDDGTAMSNAGALSDGNPANALPLNAVVGGPVARPAVLTIQKGGDDERLAQARDVLVWVEYEEP